jgi:hypothetical protein
MMVMTECNILRQMSDPVNVQEVLGRINRPLSLIRHGPH